MIQQLKDSWIGLFEAVESDVLHGPAINACTIHIKEVKGNAESTSSNAEFDITNCDVNKSSLSGIHSVVVEIAAVQNINDLKNQDTNLPSMWKVLDTVAVNNSSRGVTGSDNAFSFIVKNITVNNKGLYHKFRLKFINEKGNIGRVILPFTDKFTGTFSDNIFTTVNDFWYDNELVGFTFDLLNELGTIINDHDAVVIANTANSITFAPNISYSKLSFNSSMVTQVTPGASKYYYELGEDGKGAEFNGLDDLSEIAGVFEVAAQYTYSDWRDGNTQNLTLSTNSIRLRFRNMFRHPTVDNVQMADGTTAAITQEMWSSGAYYVAFAFISASAGPTQWFPCAADTHGKWFIAQEIPVKKVSRDILPYIEVTINDLPRERHFAFWVGMRTDRQETKAPTTPMSLIDKMEPLTSLFSIQSTTTTTTGLVIT